MFDTCKQFTWLYERYLRRGGNVAILTKPFTTEKLKNVLEFLKYYDLSDAVCKEKIEVSDALLKEFCKKHLQDNAVRRQNVLHIFDYIDNETDKELLRRRYIDNQDYYDIAYEMGYCDRYMMKLYKKAFDRLVKTAENMPEFEY